MVQQESCRSHKRGCTFVQCLEDVEISERLMPSVCIRPVHLALEWDQGIGRLLLASSSSEDLPGFCTKGSARMTVLVSGGEKRNYTAIQSVPAPDAGKGHVPQDPHFHDIFLAEDPQKRQCKQVAAKEDILVHFILAPHISPSSRQTTTPVASFFSKDLADPYIRASARLSVLVGCNERAFMDSIRGQCLCLTLSEYW